MEAPKEATKCACRLVRARHSRTSASAGRESGYSTCRRACEPGQAAHRTLPLRMQGGCTLRRCCQP